MNICDWLHPLAFQSVVSEPQQHLQANCPQIVTGMIQKEWTPPNTVMSTVRITPAHTQGIPPSPRDLILCIPRRQEWPCHPTLLAGHDPTGH